MADKKISQLTSASTPLAGTEVLPIVQSGATVKATVENIVGAGTSPGSFTGLSATAKTGSLVNNSAGLTEWRIGNTTVASTGDGSGVGFYFGTTRLAGIRCAGKSGSLQTTISAWSGSVETDVWDITATNATFSNVNLVQGTAAKGVNFTANTPAAGMTSQLLNWYEEGTWTPNDQSGAGLSFTVTSARYTRIGRQVTVQFDITFPTTASTATQLMGGLPFVAGAQNYGGFVTYTDHANGLNLLLYTSAGVSYISYRQAAGGSNNTNAAYSGNIIRGVCMYFI